jgi:SSS family solute:Na+ symporter
MILLGYAFFIFILAQVVSRESNHTKDAKDYFLASKALPWWAVGGSLIAANISTEQIIGTAGSAYAMGIAIASYEWMSAITILIVGKYFLPIFLKSGIYSMPQFLEMRFGHRLKNMVAGFWICAYIFVYLTSVLWLGSLAINSMTGLDNNIALVLLAVFSVAYSMYGGLKAVAYTDIIQVVLLIAGGLVTLYIGLNLVSGDTGVLSGLQIMYEKMPEKFDLILSEDNENYKYIPGVSVLIGGMWIINLVYWGLNQYIIQRALAAKSIQEAQKGMLFAGGLKILIPFVVIFPGVIAAYLIPDLQVSGNVADNAYPEMMKLLPDGFKGLVFAALLAAVVSTIASMMNSIATIFTMDLYTHWYKDSVDSSKLVNIGRMVSVAAVVMACFIAKPLLGNFDQAFQYIQEAVTFFSPGIAAVFLMGMFWKKATQSACIWAMVASVVMSLSMMFLWDSLPFMDRAVLVFIACILIIVIKSNLGKIEQNSSQVNIVYPSFETSKTYNIGSLILVLILAGIYTVLW